MYWHFFYFHPLFYPCNLFPLVIHILHTWSWSYPLTLVSTLPTRKNMCIYSLLIQQLSTTLLTVSDTSSNYVVRMIISKLLLSSIISSWKPLWKHYENLPLPYTNIYRKYHLFLHTHIRRASPLSLSIHENFVFFNTHISRIPHFSLDSYIMKTQFLFLHTWIIRTSSFSEHRHHGKRTFLFTHVSWKPCPCFHTCTTSHSPFSQHMYQENLTFFWTYKSWKPHLSPHTYIM